ncbi:zeta toxin family protein [Aliifodinibius sp. S!AR15-10]|uniref:zeta toxin family protein n=1 Tax=Aliifodinibius sp. S!AR15-10 TaxID=2950437 RepID=UPI0028663813|nr:zeta toxin family protein [Aliifodinibius sp. S!AR15-10]MDR8393367.1 zeta toxin family protein [Aliifodinibius sp. S!AR15-10]
MLICKESDLDAYSVALMADFIRYMLIEQEQTFSFETVMSHPGKIDFLQVAKKSGYKTYLYFIATDDPEINISRVNNRVQKGGHPVPKEKITERYERSLNLLYKALKVADRAYILDNSKRRSSVLFEKKNDGKGYLQVENYPRWFEKAVIEKLN